MGLFNRKTDQPDPFSHSKLNPEPPQPGQPARLPAYLTGATLPEDYKVGLDKAARVSVVKRPSFQGRKFAMYMLGDLSGSMGRYISDGSLDYLTEAILELVEQNQWDADGVVPVVGYANRATSPLEVRKGQFNGVARRLLERGSREGIGYGTNYASGIRRVVDHYRASDDWGKRPAIVVLQSDGIDGDPGATAKLLTKYSELPIFWVLVYYGRVDLDNDPPRDEAASLRDLDDGASMPGRKTDNVSLFIAGPEPKKVQPMELYDGLLDGPAQWLQQAPRDAVYLP